MRKIVILSILAFAVFACKTSRNIAVKTNQTVTVKAFLDQPFGVDESIASFKKHFDHGVKLTKMIRRNKFDAQKVDTIFKFYTRKSEVFVYKTYFNREMLLGGVIKDKKFPLINGVMVGMKREDVFKAFNDLTITTKDSVELYSKELMRKFAFTFDSKGVLKKISFSSYVD
ncbi:MAG: hypothetical protein EHM93_06370 [Bacteroidales bacterium]|nr:MAG: hypothetical protein EHM93_06370 [Bacteroidales bacterium]